MGGLSYILGCSAQEHIAIHMLDLVHAGEKNGIFIQFIYEQTKIIGSLLAYFIY